MGILLKIIIGIWCALFIGGCIAYVRDSRFW